MADNPPPNEWDRLAMFEALAIEYEHAWEALAPLAPVGERRDAGPDGDYWMQMMRAMLARKFFARGSSVQLSKVADSMRALAVNDHPAVLDMAAHIEDEARGWIEWERADWMPTFDDLLYGRLLHADWDKFLRSQAATPAEGADLLYFGTEGVHQAVHLARLYVDRAALDGLLRPRPAGV